MSTDKSLAPLSKKELEQVSFIYARLDHYELSNNGLSHSPVESKLHKTNNYPLYEHHKLISKILDLSLLKNGEE